MSDNQAPISIEAINDDALKGATIAECEALLTAMNVMSGTLRAKAHMVHAAMEAKQTARDAARKAGVMTEEDKTALKAFFAQEEAIKASAMSDEEKAAALAKLSHVEDKPPTQNLIGDHITKDGPDVNPGT